MSTWLSRQRKDTLQEWAHEFNVTIPVDPMKSDIVDALEDHLKKHHVDDERIAPFYKPRRATSSPIKKEPLEPSSSPSASADLASVAKIVKRRATKGVEEMRELAENVFEAVQTNARDVVEVVKDTLHHDSEDSSRSATPVTTRSQALALASQTPQTPAFLRNLSDQLPVSPHEVAHYIEKHTEEILQSASEVYADTGLTERFQLIRERVSSVTSITTLMILYEAWSLRPEVLADKYLLFTLPSLLGLPPRPILLPDLFLLLSREFWGPVFLWTITTLLVPLVVSYFFNLTSTPQTAASKPSYHYKFDPLTFNLVKGLLVYVVFECDYTFGEIVDLEYVARINSALYGGPWSVVLGCAVGVIVTFYEAIVAR